ncbi:MAG: AAA family ATPase, partial [Patescibacteria group bacterium]|nr:AAA family ATPase [Patescibacteria group bacterium]
MKSTAEILREGPPLLKLGPKPEATANGLREVRLVSMELENFKGRRKGAYNFSGRSAAVYGANEAGKTTLADAWAWLLTGKDSAGATDAAIKTLDANGEAIHNIDHAVLATVEVDGEAVTLARTLVEKWTRRRGSHTAEFTGHATTYEIDGVPMPEKDWSARIADLLAPADLLPLLTDPAHFAAKLHWQQRRKLLLEVCGDLTDAEVIAGDADLARLPGILGKRALDEYRAIAA